MGAAQRRRTHSSWGSFRAFAAPVVLNLRGEQRQHTQRAAASIFDGRGHERLPAGRRSGRAASFKRRERLGKQLRLAKELMRTLEQDKQSDPAAAGRRAQAARERAAQQRDEHIEAIKKRNGGKAQEPAPAPPMRRPA